MGIDLAAASAGRKPKVKPDPHIAEKNREIWIGNAVRASDLEAKLKQVKEEERRKINMPKNQRVRAARSKRNSHNRARAADVPRSFSRHAEHGRDGEHRLEF